MQNQETLNQELRDDTKNSIKKDLYKSKVMAKFSHYSNGKLFYTVETKFGTYMFPISTIEKVSKQVETPVALVTVKNVIQLSSDLGTTNFGAEIKGSDLNRWIGKAIDSDEFINLTQ